MRVNNYYPSSLYCIILHKVLPAECLNPQTLKLGGGGGGGGGLDYACKEISVLINLYVKLVREINKTIRITIK